MLGETELVKQNLMEINELTLNNYMLILREQVSRMQKAMRQKQQIKESIAKARASNQLLERKAQNQEHDLDIERHRHLDKKKVVVETQQRIEETIQRLTAVNEQETKQIAELQLKRNLLCESLEDSKAQSLNESRRTISK